MKIKGMQWLFGIFLFLSMVVSGCAYQSHLGMIADPQTGLAQGSAIQKNIFLDSSQFKNKKIKISIRNTSGDSDFNLYAFKKDLQINFLRKGYETTDEDDFGIKFDVNVVYSGQVTRNMAKEFGLLGGAVGGIVGYRAKARAGTAIGIVSGATIGHIIGSYVTEETYIVIAEVRIGISKSKKERGKKVIIFSSSSSKEEESESSFTPFERQISNKIVSYAGGRNIPKGQVAHVVRQRLIRILSDVI